MPNENRYPMPYIGQPYVLKQNEHTVEYGSITGFKITGTTIGADGEERKTWAAAVESPLSHTFRFYHDTPVGDWRPCTPKEIAKMRGAAVAGDVVPLAQHAALVAEHEKLAARLASFEERFAAASAPPAAEPTNGRTSRVPRV